MVVVMMAMREGDHVRYASEPASDMSIAKGKREGAIPHTLEPAALQAQGRSRRSIHAVRHLR